MKRTLRTLVVAMLIIISRQTYAQGTLIFDQQSTSNPPSFFGDYLNVQADNLTQAFIPTLSSIGFVQFQFWDVPNNGTNGATVYVNLWTGSPNINSATLLGSTAPVYMPDGFGSPSSVGISTFYFGNPITLTLGQTYYFQPIVSSGDYPWGIAAIQSTYLGGGLYFGGINSSNTSLWFREGVVSVPEPTILALIGTGLFLILGFKRRFGSFSFFTIGMLMLSVAHADTYYLQSLGGVGSLPLPMNFYTNSVAIEEISKGVYLIKDGTPRNSSKSRMINLSGPPSPLDASTNGSGTNATYQNFTPPSYGSNDLWLSIDSVTNGIAQLTIHPPWNDMGNSWDLFYTTNLATPFTNWWWILRTDYGQTNLVVPNANNEAGFYALGHADGSGRPQAFGDFETLCSNTPRSIVLQPVNPSYTYTVLTHPTNGVLTGTPPNMVYTATICSGGVDSFTFKVNDGNLDSAPATVSFYIFPDNIYANPVSLTTCRNTPVSFALDGGNCSGSPSYGLLSSPSHGVLSGAVPYLSYTPTNAIFTGSDSFNYIVFNNCGDAATNSVTITIDDFVLYPRSQSVMTGTNQPVAILLSVADYSPCNDDTNKYNYLISGNLTNGMLSGTPPNLIYRPTNGVGIDSFEFNVADSGWTSGYPATVTIFTVTPPILFTNCNPFDTAVRLDWNLEDAVKQLRQRGLYIRDFVVYRSGVSGGPYTAIYTNYNVDLMSYWDTNAVANENNYYAVTFEFYDSSSGITYESPLSNEIHAVGQHPNTLLPADAVWDVTDITDINNPVHLGEKRAPFSGDYPYQYPNQYYSDYRLYPWPNSSWPVKTTWTNHIVLNLSTNVDLSQVRYSIAIDNDYWLYVNGSTNPISSQVHEGYAFWSELKAFTNNFGSTVLHYGTNDIGIVIQDRADVNYFSMIVTTNSCGW